MCSQNCSPFHEVNVEGSAQRINYVSQYLTININFHLERRDNEHVSVRNSSLHALCNLDAQEALLTKQLTNTRVWNLWPVPAYYLLHAEL
jgi:hypothetical protein